MKKIITLFLIGLALVSCNKTRNKETSMVATQDSIIIDSTEYNDSIIFNKQSAVRIHIFCHYALSGSQALKDSINTWICEQLGDSTSHFLNNLPSLLGKQGKSWLREDSIEAAEILVDMADSDWGVNYEKDYRIEKVYEDEDFITLTNMNYQYSNGAHGSTLINGATFSKKDGHKLGWELVSSMSRDSLITTIKKGLMKYFEISGNIKNDDGSITTEDEQFRIALLVDSLILPSTAPYLTKEGICIIYQQYEIACYAAGMPTLVLPFPIKNP